MTKRFVDATGRALNVTDANGRVSQTSATYDALDNIATKTDPKLRIERYAYDLGGNLTKRTDRKGQITRGRSTPLALRLKPAR